MNFTKGRPQEAVIFVGSPGAGKSTFWSNYCKTYARVNNDELKTPAKCQKAMRDALKAGKSVVIDNTNPKAMTRLLYLKIAKEYKVPTRVVFFDISKEVAMHNNMQREVNTSRSHFSKKVPSIAIHTYYKYLEHPLESEGFESVIPTSFIPVFVSKEDE